MKKNQKLVRALAVVLALLLVGGTVTSAVFAALAEETGSAERDRYEMNITYLEDQQALHITQRLVYHNRQSFALDRVLFSAAGNMYRRESTLMYDAQSLTEVFPEGYAPAGIDLMRVAFGGADADWGYLDSAETVLRVACRLEPGASGEFVFEYYLLLSRNRSMLGEFDTDVRLSGFYFAPGLVNEDDEEFVGQRARAAHALAADHRRRLFRHPDDPRPLPSRRHGQRDAAGHRGSHVHLAVRGAERPRIRAVVRQALA